METVEKQTAFSHRSHSPYCYFTFHLHKRFDTASLRYKLEPYRNF